MPAGVSPLAHPFGDDSASIRHEKTQATLARSKRLAAKVAVEDGSSSPSYENKRARTAPPRDQPPRPANAWICYRSAKVHELKTSKAFAKLPQADVSKLIGQLWREEAADVRRHYELDAARRKKEHKEAYPDYVYRPVRREKGERPSRKKPDEAVAQSAPPSKRLSDFPSVLLPPPPSASIDQFPPNEFQQHDHLSQSPPSAISFHPVLSYANFDLTHAPQPSPSFTCSLPPPPAEYRSDPFQSVFPPLAPFATGITLDQTNPYSDVERTYISPPLSAGSAGFDFGLDYAAHLDSYLDVPFSSIDPSLLAALSGPL
ncbi:pcc1 protein [Rhodotorula toruloides]|uniref:Pcc1 protein n=1 Tax=Rhodotorula toruloides TaxID=5286 RepID=A0A511K916_RHOTO|nr:pcc1 protein [Rhodotorula toruloides]